MLLIFLVLMIGVLFFIYWIPKKMGYPKVGKYLSIGLFISLMLIILYGIFQDSFFTKNQARKLLAEQEIVLIEDFNILNNKTSFAIGDYYHRFRLEVSESDKNQLIDIIKNSDNFKRILEDKLDLYSDSLEIKTSKIIQNYEDEEKYVKELFRPHHEGENATYYRVEIEKSVNTLVYEKIVK